MKQTAPDTQNIPTSPNNSTGGHPSTDHKPPIKEKNPKKWILIGIIAVAAALVIGGSVWGVNKYREQQYDETVNVDTFYNGIVVNSVELGGKTKEQAAEELKALEPTLRGSANVTLTYGDHAYTFTPDDFTYTYNTEEILEEAYEVGRDGSIKERYKEIKSLEKEPVTFTITATVSEDSVREKIAQIAAELDCDPKESRVSSFDPFGDTMFTFEEGQDGVKVDQDSAFTTLLSALQNGSQESIELPVTVTPHTRTIEEAQAATQLVSSFSTTSTNNANANSNMNLALQNINGTIVEPGATFSFNGIVGDSTTAAGGWLPAGAISQGKLIQEYGGGICQASTTLYGAVLRADLEVTERHCHRWPSSYVPIGQDASIDYGNLDFQFVNNTDYQVFIRAWMSGVTLNVEIYGKHPDTWDTIEVYSEQTATLTPDATIYKDDPSLPKGTEEVEVSSRYGSEAEGSKIYYKDGVQVDSEAIDSSYYAPVQGIVRVGTGE